MHMVENNAWSGYVNKALKSECMHFMYIQNIVI